MVADIWTVWTLLLRNFATFQFHMSVEVSPPYVCLATVGTRMAWSMRLYWSCWKQQIGKICIPASFYPSIKHFLYCTETRWWGLICGHFCKKTKKHKLEDKHYVTDYWQYSWCFWMYDTTPDWIFLWLAIKRKDMFICLFQTTYCSDEHFWTVTQCSLTCGYQCFRGHAASLCYKHLKSSLLFSHKSINT